MSAAVVSSIYQPVQNFEDYGSGASAVGLFGVDRQQGAVGVRVISEAGAKETKPDIELRNFIVTKKLKGFISQNDGDTWRVTFIHNGKESPYDLPAGHLKKAGVSERYQPFEMDELQPLSPDVAGKVYRFRPLAKAADVFNETLPLDSERQRKYDLIIARLQKSKG